MTSSDLQFGFKRNLGCSRAVSALHQCVEYFIARGRMCDIGVPQHVIKLIMNWYSKVMMIVR